MSQREKSVSGASVWAPVDPGDEPPPIPSWSRDTFDRSPGAQERSDAEISLARSLIEKQYHPVMLFGTAASGKSSMLASLFHYLQNDPRSEAICMLGEWILPVETKEGADVAELVSRFFHHAVMNFNTGKAVPRTRSEVPFFIPIVLRSKHGKPDIRLAFLESAGENYKIQQESVEYFPRLKNQILDVYRNFPSALSILVVAPYTLKDAYTDQEIEQADDPLFQEVDQSLYGALQSYQQNRRWLDIDNYMFVLTKWDVYAGGLANPEFSNPPNGLVEKIIQERYRLSWNFYRTMPKSGNSNSMQYSSGLITGESVIAIPENLKPFISKFPRALWNWLYINASGGISLYGTTVEAQKNNSFISLVKKILS